MGFLEFMLGKRLIDDEVDRFASTTMGLAEALSQTEWSKKKRAKARESTLAKKWPAFEVAALNALAVGTSTWTPAGDVALQPSGELAIPAMPESAGLARLDMIGPELGEHLVLLSEHEHLNAEDESWDAELDANAHLLAGGRFTMSYLDHATAPTGVVLDLTATANRLSLIRTIEQQAERSGYWLVHPIEDRNVLILDTEGFVR